MKERIPVLVIEDERKTGKAQWDNWGSNRPKA